MDKYFWLFLFVELFQEGKIMIYISIIIGIVLWIVFFWFLTDLILSKKKILWSVPFFLVVSISILYSSLVILKVSLESYAIIFEASFLFLFAWIFINIWRFENGSDDK